MYKSRPSNRQGHFPWEVSLCHTRIYNLLFSILNINIYNRHEKKNNYRQD